MIACTSPLQKNAEESFCLCYANRAKNIQNLATVIYLWIMIRLPVKFTSGIGALFVVILGHEGQMIWDFLSEKDRGCGSGGFDINLVRFQCFDAFGNEFGVVDKQPQVTGCQEEGCFSIRNCADKQSITKQQHHSTPTIVMNHRLHPWILPTLCIPSTPSQFPELCPTTTLLHHLNWPPFRSRGNCREDELLSIQQRV